MHALDFLLFPKLFESGEPRLDRDDRISYSVDHCREQAATYERAIEFVQLWESRAITLSLTEYRNLPAIVLAVRAAYKKYLANYADENK